MTAKIAQARAALRDQEQLLLQLPAQADAAAPDALTHYGPQLERSVLGMVQEQAQRLQAELQRSGQPTPSHGAVPLPPSELLWRVTAAVALAATVLAGAPLGLPDAVSGALLALPIAGSVLPCFTLPRHGALATCKQRIQER